MRELLCRLPARVVVLAGMALLGVLPVSPLWSQQAEGAPRRLTTDGKRKEDLAWSPDGKRLACSYYHQSGRIGIGVLDLNAAGTLGPAAVLTTDPVERSPAWSPDGKRLAFIHVTQSGTDGELDVWVMNAEGKERKPLVNTGGKSFDNFPSWSPDGTRLLFTTTRDKTQELYAATGEGKELARLSADTCLKQYPRWSPDGKQVAFNANRDGNFEIYVMPMDPALKEREWTRLTEHPSMDVAPAWSPDGEWLAWVSNRDENLEVYVMDRQGKRVRNVSRHPGYDHFPAWRADGVLTWVSDRDGRLDVYALRP